MLRVIGLLCVGSALVLSGCGPVRRQTYEACLVDVDCVRSPDTCVQITTSATRSMCTRSCSVAADCPTSLDGRPGLCLEDGRCYSACTLIHGECPSGWSCQISVRGETCLPS